MILLVLAIFETVWGRAAGEQSHADGTSVAQHACRSRSASCCLLFANVTAWGDTVTEFLREEQTAQFHSVGFVEHHLVDSTFPQANAKFMVCGFRATFAPASLTGRSFSGNSGGAALAVRSHMH